MAAGEDSSPPAKRPRLDRKPPDVGVAPLVWDTLPGCGLPVLQLDGPAGGTEFSVNGLAVPTGMLQHPLRQQLLCNPGAATAGGAGAVLIRGLQWPEDIEEQRTLFLKWATVLGLRAVPQSTDLRELVADVTARPPDLGDRLYRGYRNPFAQKLHCDANRPSTFGTAKCDVLAMLCVRASDEGGASKLLKAEALHRAISEERPDLYERLCSAWPWFGERDWMDEWGPRKDLLVGLPLLSKGSMGDEEAASNAGWHAVQYGKILRQNVEAGFEARDAEGAGPPMSDLDKEALDFLESVANREALFFRLRLQPGEVLLLNNYAWMHGRDAFPEQEADGGKRHMMRMWLKL